MIIGERQFSKNDYARTLKELYIKPGANKIYAFIQREKDSLDLKIQLFDKSELNIKISKFTPIWLLKNVIATKNCFLTAENMGLKLPNKETYLNND